MIIAFDLDGTLANIEHRLHFINGKPKDWPAFFRACVDDEPISEMINLQRSLCQWHEVEIWSGRSNEVWDETVKWLNRNHVIYSKLRMRMAGDYRVDNVVKEAWLLALEPSQRPLLAFDDRQQVVDMWRRNGIRCCQVAPGDF